MTAFSNKILKWYDQHGRKNLPWQKNLSDKKNAPYRVWVSEIMLQQTQVSTVIPYYETFIKRFPTVESLATAPQDEVLHHWSGLGFYARARNLHTTAKAIVEKYNGKFPDEVTKLYRLPGIGPSTAGAIMSIAFKKHAVILDGNVKRVLARHFLLEGVPVGKPEKAFWEMAEKHTPHERVHHYTQAIMDLGATLCTSSQPRCPDCPLKRTCLARKHNRIDELPHRPNRKTLPVKETQMLMVLNPGGEVFLQQRPPRGIWGSLWSLPELSIDTNTRQWCEQRFGTTVKQLSPLPEIMHTFSHYHLRIHPIQVKLSTTPAQQLNDGLQSLWVKGSIEEAALKKGLATPVSKLLKTLHNQSPSKKPAKKRAKSHA